MAMEDKHINVTVPVSHSNQFTFFFHQVPYSFYYNQMLQCCARFGACVKFLLHTGANNMICMRDILLWHTDKQTNGSSPSQLYFVVIIYNIIYILYNIYINIYIVKWSRYRPGVAQRVGRGIATLRWPRHKKAVSGQQHAPAALYPRERPGTHFRENGCAPGPVWMGGKSRPQRDSIPDLQPVVSRYTDWATRPTYIYIYIYIYT